MPVLARTATRSSAAAHTGAAPGAHAGGGRRRRARPWRWWACSVALAACLPAAAQHAAQGPATAAVYDFDPAHTFVYFEVLHFGTSTLRARLGPVAGQVEIDRARGRGSLSVRVRTASVDSGLRVLDARLREADLLGSEAHPEAFFVARQFRFAGTALQEVRGEFTFRGVSQPLSLQTRLFGCRDDATTQREVCGGDFEGEVLRSEFGATFGLPFVADRVHLRVQVEGWRRPE